MFFAYTHPPRRPLHALPPPSCARPMLGTMPWLPSLVAPEPPRAPCFFHGRPGRTRWPGLHWRTAPLGHWMDAAIGWMGGAAVPSPSLRWLPDQSTQLCLPFHSSTVESGSSRVLALPSWGLGRSGLGCCCVLIDGRARQVDGRGLRRGMRRGLPFWRAASLLARARTTTDWGVLRWGRPCASVVERAGRAQLEGRRVQGAVRSMVWSEFRPPDSRPAEYYFVPASPEQGARESGPRRAKGKLVR